LRNAQDAIDEAKDTNRQATGVPPKYETYVDGRKGAALSSVKPDGVIVAEFDLGLDAIKAIAAMLYQNSPALTGRYRRENLIFIDGQEFRMGDKMPSSWREVVFVNATKYARKIERGGIEIQHAEIFEEPPRARREHAGEALRP
jgi:hypothetical protein